MPRLLRQPMIEIRNNVIHRGLLPEKKDALAFGADAYEVIQSGMKKLRAECLADVNAELSEHVGRIAAKMGDAYPRSFQVTPTALNVIEDISNGYRPFATLLAERNIS